MEHPPILTMGWLMGRRKIRIVNRLLSCLRCPNSIRLTSRVISRSYLVIEEEIPLMLASGCHNLLMVSLVVVWVAWVVV
jgi:hypothetical protein